MSIARPVVLMVGLALCAGCGAGPAGPSSVATQPSSAVASRSTTGATAQPSESAASGARLAPMVPGDIPGSPTAQRAMDAVLAISVAMPHTAYGGVIPGGGNGIVVSVLPGGTDKRLRALLDQAVRDGVIVQVRTGSATLAQLEALGDRGIWTRLPAELSDHCVATQVDVENNRVIATFDLPLDDALRATVARIFGDQVAVAHGSRPRTMS